MTWDVSDVTHQKHGLRFEKSQLVEFCRRKKKVDFCLLVEALWWVHTRFGADGKVSIERFYLSPYIEKPFHSKLIKSFVSELRSRVCFFFFIWVMNILCTFPISIFISGYVTERDTNHKSLCKPYHTPPPPPNVWCFLWCLRSQLISSGRDQTDPLWSDSKNPTTCFNGWTSTTHLFKILKFSGPSLPGMMSTTLSIHSNAHPTPFPVWRFIMADDDCHILST